MSETDSRIQIELQRASVYFVGALSGFLLLLKLVDSTSGILSAALLVVLYVFLALMMLVGARALYDAERLREQEMLDKKLENIGTNIGSVNGYLGRLISHFRNFNFYCSRAFKALSLVFIIGVLLALQGAVVKPNLFIDNSNTGQIEVDSHNTVVSDLYLEIKPRYKTIFGQELPFLISGARYNYTFEWPGESDNDSELILVYPDQNTTLERVECKIVYENRSEASCLIDTSKGYATSHTPFQIHSVPDDVRYIRLITENSKSSFGHLDIRQEGRIYDTKVVFKPQPHRISDWFVDAEKDVNETVVLPDKLIFRWDRKENPVESRRFELTLQGRNSEMNFLNTLLPTLIGGLITGGLTRLWL